MSKLLLPIDHNPVFISRYESAVPFSVIQAQQISIEPLIATQMMNFHYSQNFVWEFDTIKDMTWYSDCKLFFKYLYTFDCHIPGWSKSDIQEILLFALNHGHYIHSKVDTFYFPEDESFDTFHRVTECLIYGCDDEREIFYCKIGIVTFNQYDKIFIAFMEHAKDFLHDCENYNRNRNKMLIKGIIQDVDWLVEWDARLSGTILDGIKENCLN